MAAADAPRIQQGEAIALVLGAGGARGLAQIGVIEALLARDMRIVAVAGSSSGALVGGMYSANKLAELRDWALGLSRSSALRMLDPVFGRPALFGGARLLNALREVAGPQRIEALPTNFTAVAVDLIRQREVWLRDGDLSDAIRASIAIPGLLTPHTVNGRALVDGGLLAPLPIAATRLSGAHRLIAVDMHSWPRHPPGKLARNGNGNGHGDEGHGSSDAPGATPQPEPGRSRLSGWFGRHFREGESPAVTGADKSVSADDGRDMGFNELMARSLDTMQAQIARVQLALDPPELVIRIPRDACQFYEFWRAAELIDVGRTEAEKALDAAGY